mmetsp:Transcript_93352/g.264273  ORF Transcript_93352/g.264273 Transcript_93352/m.264273 type:complete len:208 (-) Transcript_93352:327-950(-)
MPVDRRKLLRPGSSHPSAAGKIFEARISVQGRKKKMRAATVVRTRLPISFWSHSPLSIFRNAVMPRICSWAVCADCFSMSVWLVPSRSMWRYHAATAWRICSGVARPSEAPRPRAVLRTSSTSSLSTGKDSFSATRKECRSSPEGMGPPPTLCLVNAAPTDFGMWWKAYQALRAKRTSAREMPSSGRLSATLSMYPTSSSLGGRPPL